MALIIAGYLVAILYQTHHVDKRFDDLVHYADKRFDDLLAYLDLRFKGVENRLDKLEHPVLKG